MDTDHPNPDNIKLIYTKKDIASLRQMWDDIFQDRDEFTDYYFDKICNNNKILVAYDGDEAIGMTHLNSYKVKCYDRELDCYYIVGVAVKRKYRNLGIMKKMLSRILDDYKDKNDGFFFLMPKKKEYYTGIGFKPIYSTLSIEGNIMDEDEASEEMEMEFSVSDLFVDDLSEYDVDGVKNIASTVNEKLADKYKVYSIRDKEYMDRMLMEHMCQNGDVGVILNEGDQLAGLFSYEIYDGILYAERIENFEINICDMLKCIVKLAIENACVGFVATIPDEEYDDNILDIPGVDIHTSEGCGIMAYIPDKLNISYEDLKDVSFFDEIV